MRDETMPQGKWQFDQSVVDVFPDMLQRSIPNYQWMRESTSRVIKATLRGRTADILEIGCSDGQAFSSLLENGIEISTYIGLDSSEPMISSAKEKFSGDERASFEVFDFRNWMAGFTGQFDVVLSILTMQFIPIEYRTRILEELYEIIHTNGIMIFIEKTVGDSFVGQQINVDAYHQMKNDNGYSLEEIEAKRLSLEHSMQPVSARENENMLKDAGFVVQRYWQAFNFVGWVAYKKAR